MDPEVTCFNGISLVCSPRRLWRAILRPVVHARRSGRSDSTQRTRRPPPPEFNSSQPSLDGDPIYRQRSDLAWEVDPSLSSICNLLGEGDIRTVGRLPVSAGRSADLWMGSLENREVAIKSYRRYLTIDSSTTFVRFAREALVCSRLSHKNIVSFIGVYSTPSHPFSLLFDFAGHFDLKRYLQTHPTARRLELLVGIARGLDHMHDLDVVHRKLETGNVLVDFDGTVRIAGLGSALILSDPAPRSDKSVERLFRGIAPELMHPEEFGLPYSRHCKASDVYAFGMLSWEVFTGRAIFSSSLDAVVAHSVWKGARPPRPVHPEVTDQLWNMMEQCWEAEPSKRAIIKRVVRILEAEYGARFYATA